MAHIEPRPRTAVDELQGIFAGAEAAMGFVPNSMLTMAHMPQLPAAFFALTSVVFGGDLMTRIDQTICRQILCSSSHLL